MRIRLQDVAALAGVSEATVSRVMNAKSGVSPKTQERVVRVLAELGYTPSSLRPAPRAGVVGLIVPELDNPIFPKFVQSIEARLLASGYLCALCCATRFGATEDEYVEALLDQRVAGIVVISGRHADLRADHGIYDDIVERGVALVTVNGAMPSSAVASVSTDDRGAARVAYRHLSHLGHRRIGLVTGPDCYVPVVRKVEGFRQAAAEAGEQGVDDMVVETIFTLEGGYTGALRLIDAGATGIVAASDMMALGAIRAVRDRGLSVPDDVSVVGFDDTELMRFTDPPLTTVHQPVTRLVDHAADVLLAQIEGRPVELDERLIPGELIVRGTTARAPSPRT